MISFRSKLYFQWDGTFGWSREINTVLPWFQRWTWMSMQIAVGGAKHWYMLIYLLLTDYCRVPVKKDHVTMSVPPGCTPSALFNLKKDGRPKSPGTASARCTSRFWWCDPQLWPRCTSSSWTTWTVTMSTWRPACALAVRNRLCLLHVLQRRERIWVESKNVPSFSAISCFVQSLKIRGVSQLKISLAGLFWVLL